MNAKDKYFFKVLGVTIIAILMVSLIIREVYGSSNTVLLFDDFNSGTLDTSVWQFQTNSSGSGYTIANGTISINSGTTNGGGGWLFSNSSFVPDDDVLIFETRARVSDINWLSFWGLFGGPSEVAGFGIIRSNTLAFDSTTGSGSSDIQITLAQFPALDLLDWHDYRIEVSNSVANYYIDDQLVATVNDQTYLPGGLPLQVRLDKGSDGIKRELQIDYVRISKRPLVSVVAIDIKPGSDPNCFNNNGQGVIPVAILTSVDFDATQVDPTTVALDGQAIRVVGKKGNLQSHIEDSNGDGLDDLVIQIEDEDGTYEEGETVATLTGETFDGTQIQGTDTLCIVP